MLEIKEYCKDLPIQITNMINDCKLFLQSKDINVEDKVIIKRYSAGSKFAQCYTVLQPNMVKTCICGGNSGLGIVPLSHYKEQTINFPIGTNNIKEFDFELFKSIPQLYYLGTKDCYVYM